MPLSLAAPRTHGFPVAPQNAIAAPADKLRAALRSGAETTFTATHPTMGLYVAKDVCSRWPTPLSSSSFGPGGVSPRRFRAVQKPGRRFGRVKAGIPEHVEWAMRADIYPLQVLLLTFTGWVHRHQADVIAYLVEENRVLNWSSDLRGASHCSEVP